MVCAACGAENPAESKFCMTCGSLMETESQTSSSGGEQEPPAEQTDTSAGDAGSDEAVEQQPGHTSGGLGMSEGADPSEVTSSASSADPASSEEEVGGWRQHDVPEPVANEAEQPASAPPPPPPPQPSPLWNPPVAGAPPPVPPAGPTPQPPWGGSPSGPAPGPSPYPPPAAPPGWGAPPPPQPGPPGAPPWGPPPPVGGGPPPPGAPPWGAPGPASGRGFTPGPVDPNGLAVLVARLSGGARKQGRAALMVAASLLKEGERVQGLVQGTLAGRPAAGVLTDQRLVFVIDREWKPDVTEVDFSGDLTVQGWQDGRTASLIVQAGGRSYTVERIADVALAHELAAALRHRAGQAQSQS